MNTTTHIITSVSKLVVIAVAVSAALGVLYVFDWLQTAVPESTVQYADLPPEQRLQAAPQEVLHSRAYLNAAGAEEIQYAYLAAPAPVTPGEDLGRRTPESQTELLDVTYEDSQRIEQLRTTFFSKPQFASWFEPDWQVYSERTIMFENSEYRPDRFIVKGNKAIGLWRNCLHPVGPPKWNYTKYLCDTHGFCIRSYGPSLDPMTIVPDINTLIL